MDMSHTTISLDRIGHWGSFKVILIGFSRIPKGVFS